MSLHEGPRKSVKLMATCRVTMLTHSKEVGSSFHKLISKLDDNVSFRPSTSVT